MSTADDLRAAAQYIRDHGWHQGSGESRDGRGSVCALGGIARVCGIAPMLACYEPPGDVMRIVGAEPVHRYVTATDALREYLAEEAGTSDLYQVPRWNDDDARTPDDVTAALEKAAARIEEQVT